ncbi:glycosyltransferase [soil metagenome]
MTVLNEEKSLPGFLATISAQIRLPSEIVVVDGGSRDKTVAVLEKWATESGIELVVVVEAGANISQGRNLAISLASHEVVAVTDAGTLLDPHWMRRLLDQWEPGIEVVGGFFEPFGNTFMESTIAFTITPLLEEIDGAKFLPSSRSLLLSKAAWERAGGYPEWLDYCEDLVFDLSLKASGSSFAFAPEAIAKWSGRSSLKAFSKQYYRYARGDGKADLWSRRHAVRYGTYVLGLAGVTVGGRVGRTLVAVGFAKYQFKFLRRVWMRRRALGATTAPALGLVPVIVVVGDVSKIAGYPVGVLWRLKNRSRGSSTS